MSVMKYVVSFLIITDFLKKQSTSAVPQSAILDVKIKEIAIQKRSVQPFLPNGCVDPAGGAAVSQFYAAVKYSITNSGSSDFTPSPGYNGIAECSQKPAVYKFLQLSGLLSSGDTTIPLKYVTCVVDDMTAGGNACSAAQSGMVIGYGRSFGMSQDLTVKFDLTQSQFSALLSTNPDQILNVKLSVNPLIADGSPGTASLKLGSALNDANWFAANVFPSPVVIYTDSSSNCALVLDAPVVANYQSSNSITGVCLTTNVNSISFSAFESSSITSIFIPGTVLTIGNAAFRACSKLTTVTISVGVQYIDDSAFERATALTSVFIPSTVSTIGDSAFYGCTKLAFAIISVGVQSIGHGAFYGDTALTSVFIPSTVTIIGGAAFTLCTGLISATISAGVQSIGINAFNGATALTSVVIPSTVSIIKDNAFYNCFKLTSATISAGVQYISTRAFQFTGLTSVSIPSTVLFIGDLAFSDCTQLTSVTISAGVTTIGLSAFQRDTALEAVTIPSTVTNLRDYSFGNIPSLTSVTLTQTLYDNRGNAFSGSPNIVFNKV